MPTGTIFKATSESGRANGVIKKVRYIMTKQQIFPTILIALDILASIPYFANGDIKKGIYWIAAAVLTATVTF